MDFFQIFRAIKSPTLCPGILAKGKSPSYLKSSYVTLFRTSKPNLNATLAVYALSASVQTAPTPWAFAIRSERSTNFVANP
ncbi:Uncharacterized protein APZ42_027895 [Daphnia magna]|uniref:Uncharacterized protein n=1 Tax=Daphnia magna TaxID=35525 RepID=A0A164QZA7_9CRUS|nr:Uncharacterized protein APZ42_027895 [Daphnia magna]